MVREGYKLTEIGVLPKDWSVKKLGDLVGQLEAGISVNSVNEERGMYEHDESILKTSSVHNGEFFPEECKKIAPKDIKRARVNPRKDTIIISRMNTPALVGECGYVGADYSTLFLPDRLWATHFKRESEVVPKWLALLLSYGPVNKAIKDTATGTSGSMKNIAKNALLSIYLPIPPVVEQQAIAKALSDVDGLIDGLEQLIAKKRDIKTATMQQLLTGKTRLPGFGEGKGYKQTELGEIPEDWEVVYFKNCCSSFKTGKLDANAMKQDGEYHFYTCARYPFRIDTYAFDLEALIVSGNGANVGYVHYYSGKFNAYQRTYVLSGFSADVGFLKVYLERNLADRIHVEVNKGSTPYITMDTLTDMQLALPSFQDEQVAIAKILVDMGSEIDAIKSRLDKVKVIKQGMMQELLTGRIRLI